VVFVLRGTDIAPLALVHRVEANSGLVVATPIQHVLNVLAPGGELSFTPRPRRRTG